jgi:ADP-ribose pyrophosphatase YjhB (NUDIX family)
MSKNSKGASLILIKGKKALLMLRDKNRNISYPNCWGLNGGKVEKGETFKKAAIRELKEETGYKSKSPIFFQTTEYTNDKGVKIKAKRFYEVYDGLQELNCYEGQKICFFSENDINRLKVFPSHGVSAINAIKSANKVTS